MAGATRPTNSNERSPLLSSNNSNHDPAIARTNQIASNSIGGYQNLSQPVPTVSRATAQQSLSLPEGQYIGDTQDGLPNGRGTLTYPKGKERKKYEGEWREGKFHGGGVLWFSGESRFEGQWEKGLLHGHGIQILAEEGKYEGTFAYGKREGKGTYVWNSGERYVGEYTNDLRNGQGTYTFKEGTQYSGEWKDNNKHGQGQQNYTDGRLYSGEWKEDLWHGQGELRTSNGCIQKGIFSNNTFMTGTSGAPGGVITHYKEGWTSGAGNLTLSIPAQSDNSNNVDPVVLKRAMEMIAGGNPGVQPPIVSIPQVTQQQTLMSEDGQYVGEVLNGVPHGRGVLTYFPGKERKKYDGQWQNGRFHGEGILRFSNETRFEGRWENGQLHGRGMQVFESGDKYEGTFAHGLREGKGTYVWTNGNKYVGDWKNNRSDGQGIMTESNGWTYSGGWKNGKHHGQGTSSNSNNGHKYSGGWENGNKHGQGTEDIGGGYIYSGGWKNGKYHGQGELKVEWLTNKKGIFKNGEIWTGSHRRTTGLVYTYENGVQTGPSAVAKCWHSCAIQ